MSIRNLTLLLAFLAGCSLLYEERDGEEDEGFCGDNHVDAVTGETCDDGGQTNGDGCSAMCRLEQRVTVRWAFFPSVNGAAQDGACRAGVARVELATTSANQTPRTFVCDENRTGTMFAPVNELVFARLRDAGDVIVAESIPQKPVNNFANAQFYEDAGYVHVSWAWRDSQGDAIQCPTSAPPVELALAPQAGGPTITQTYPCASIGLHYSPAVPEGTYTLTLTSFRGEQTAVGVIVRNNNRVTDLAFADL